MKNIEAETKKNDEDTKRMTSRINEKNVQAKELAKNAGSMLPHTAKWKLTQTQQDTWHTSR